MDERIWVRYELSSRTDHDKGGLSPTGRRSIGPVIRTPLGVLMFLQVLVGLGMVIVGIAAGGGQGRSVVVLGLIFIVFAVLTIRKAQT
jgi:hypothetical protein